MAKGSHATRGGWEPKTCTTCGQRILIKDTADYRYTHSQPPQVYARCKTCLGISEAQLWGKR